jgi:hypothetical protein
LPICRFYRNQEGREGNFQRQASPGARSASYGHRQCPSLALRARRPPQNENRILVSFRAVPIRRRLLLPQRLFKSLTPTRMLSGSVVGTVSVLLIVDRYRPKLAAILYARSSQVTKVSRTKPDPIFFLKSRSCILRGAIKRGQVDVLRRNRKTETRTIISRSQCRITLRL